MVSCHHDLCLAHYFNAPIHSANFFSRKCARLLQWVVFYSRKVHFFVHLFNNFNYGGSKHSNLRSASKTKRKKNKTRPEPRKHTKDRTRLKGPPFDFFRHCATFFSEKKHFPKGSPLQFFNVLRQMDVGKS